MGIPASAVLAADVLTGSDALQLVALMIGVQVGLIVVWQRFGEMRFRQQMGLRKDLRTAVEYLEHSTEASAEMIVRLTSSLDAVNVHVEVLGGVVAQLLKHSPSCTITPDRFGEIHQRLMRDLHRGSAELRLLHHDAGERRSALQQLRYLTSSTNRTRRMVEGATRAHPDDELLRGYLTELSNEGM